MLIEIKIKLKKMLLGDQRSPKGIRVFRRDENDDFVVDMSTWFWALDEAAKALHIDELDFTAIRLPSAIRKATIISFVHDYTYKGMPQKETFEAVREGAVLTFEIVLASTGQDSRRGRAPSFDDLRQMFDLVGEQFGISPWGSSYGFGRFAVQSFKIK